MKKPHGKDRRRHLHGEEEAIWEHTARSVEPLKAAKAKGRVHPADDLHEEAHHRPRAKAPAHEAAAHTAKHARKVQPEPVAPARKAAPPIADVDRKKLKRLRSGRTEIDGRIDLHGMRQDEAHGALRAFLHRAQAKGWRWVLVITGKGSVLAREDHDEPFDMMRPRDRGILKRNVPRWLEEPDLRPLVISFTTAAIEHGGEGALYVHLRKRG